MKFNKYINYYTHQKTDKTEKICRLPGSGELR